MTSMESSRPPASVFGLAKASEVFGGATKRPLQFGQAPELVASDPAKTLSVHFGYDAFRAGQREVVEAAIAGRDTAVFWATGAGKSICYQLPALHLGRTVVVVSPLVSLMVDQVTKFNATAGAAPKGPRACLLGSAQIDPQVETDAMKGLYQLVYVTPEKLSLSSILDKLKILHAEGALALLAVDEAHCISEWGHDFRPAYRQLKRVREVIPGLPIMTLTATAVPRVQNDILEQLCMKSPEVSRKSFDRPNLNLVCTRKQSKGVDLARLAKVVAEPGSTIVYVPTQADTDMVATFLTERLQAVGVEVRSYHGGKFGPDREAAHMDFLSGRAQVIVATVAFGMGIDKPDIRRIVHYGPPKTVEEYFQQIGRAGRDGLAASCELIAADGDFNNYASEFYTKGLTPEQRETQLKSTDALRSFAVGCGCRRRWLLEYFGEVPSFGDHCGTCDVCKTSVANAGDLTRDFRLVVACVLQAVAATESFPLAMTQLLSMINGSWKPRNDWGSDKAKAETVERIKRMKAGLTPVMRRDDFMKEMITTLCNQGYLERQRKSMAVGTGTYVNTFEVFIRTAKGRDATAGTMEVRLPVPMAVRQQEEQEKRKTELKKQELIKGGVDLKTIPVHELEQGEGVTINAQLAWTRRIKHLCDLGQEDKACKLKELVSRILAWRASVAQKLRMAPGAVLAETLVFNIAYSQPTSVDGLRGSGVRIVNVDELAELMQASVKELFPKDILDNSGNGESGAPDASPVSSAAMLLPEGPWTAPMKWEKAFYKTAKNGALPGWEQYYNRVTGGDHPVAVAMNPPSGKAVQVGTVLNHCLTALTHGKPVHLRLLLQQCELVPPNEDEWRRLEEGAAVRNVSVDADDYKSKEVLCGVLGPENVNMESADKSVEQKAVEAKWYSHIRVWEALRRVRFPVQFEAPSGDAKRQKLA